MGFSWSIDKIKMENLCNLFPPLLPNPMQDGNSFNFSFMWMKKFEIE
jgi:hypothetical protein